MLAVLSTVAEMERELTVERIREGMAKAKIYGTRHSRPSGKYRLALKKITYVESWGYYSYGLCLVDRGQPADVI